MWFPAKHHVFSSLRDAVGMKRPQDQAFLGLKVGQREHQASSRRGTAESDANKRLRGEWFNLDEQDVDNLKIALQ